MLTAYNPHVCCQSITRSLTYSQSPASTACLCVAWISSCHPQPLLQIFIKNSFRGFLVLISLGSVHEAGSNSNSNSNRSFTLYTRIHSVSGPAGSE